MKNEIDLSYMRQIQKFPLLSLQDEVDLSDKIKKGDKKALSALVNSNLRLVVSIALKFTRTTADVMDLIQEGNMGLMVAAKKYNPSFNTRFSTYAYAWITQYMLRFVKSRTQFISLPARKEELLRRVKDAQANLYELTGKEPSEEEVASYLGMDMEELKSVFAYSYSVASLDCEVSDDDPSTLASVIADSDSTPEERFMIEEEKEHLYSLIAGLPVNEQKVLKYRYNFANDLRLKTLREIGKLMGVTPEAVRQTEIRAVKHLKHAVLAAV